MTRFLPRFLPLIAAVFLSTILAQPASAGILNLHTKKPTESGAATDNASKQPDKELYDKAMKAMKQGKYDVARLDLQTMLNTYPESEYQMRAKLAVGDSWFRQGGSAALAQAEAEYKDFITFFPNQPEAAEAQMRVADIYYMQMEKPDRDHTNADRAEQEYRTMIEQYPDSDLVPRAKQRLREVQEVLAERQYEIGSYYFSRENWPATIARLQDLTDSYPLYSHSDAALIDLGDSYAGEARYTQTLKMDAKAKQELMKAYDDRAADAYARVVTHYSSSPHVEDARERLLALNRPIPEPTAQELAESENVEQSRTGISLKQRAMFLVKRGPETVNAARVGDPTITDPPQITAPDVNRENAAMYSDALAGKPVPEPGEAGSATAQAEAANNGAGSQPAPAGDNAPLQLESVPTAGDNGGGSPAIGASIVSEGGADTAPAGDGNPAPPQSAPTDSGPANTASTNPASAGSAPARPAAADQNTAGPRTANQGTADPGAAAAATAAGVSGAQNPGGLAPVGPSNTALPPVEKPAEAAAQVNDVHGANTAQVETGTNAGASNKKAPAPKYKPGEESSSKHKKKKGVKKLNPF